MLLASKENCESVINMDLLNDKDNLEDLIARFLVAEMATKVFAMLIVVDQSLATMAKILVFGNDGNRQKPVSLEDKGTGRNLQGAMNCSVNSLLRRSKSAVNNFVSSGNMSWWVSAEDSAKHVTNSAVHAFADSIGLRVLCSSRDQLDPINIKHRLKWNVSKFSARVMNDVKRARVRRKPFF
jgi:hypothetical protein